ncbi:sigma-70 family RNA polymerase sigma factor [Rubripirellula amarantea]|nr:sigma-70 family RNA polymerase sigma factor [Rubripirellula amarantea]
MGNLTTSNSAESNKTELASEQESCWEETLALTLPGLRAFLRSRKLQESDIDDCLQSVAMKAIVSGEQIPPIARRAWLFRVASNEAAKFWRTQATSRVSNDEEVDRGMTTDVPIEPLIQQETLAELKAKLLTLPKTTQTIIQMKLHQDMTFQQIADQLDIPIGTALTRMRRGLARLREHMNVENNDPSKST